MTIFILKINWNATRGNQYQSTSGTPLVGTMVLLQGKQKLIRPHYPGVKGTQWEKTDGWTN